MSASGRSCDRPPRHRFCLVSLCLSISECWDGSLYYKLLLHASHAAHQDQIKTRPNLFVMFDMYVKQPPDASPVVGNKFYLRSLPFPHNVYILIHVVPLKVVSFGLEAEGLRSRTVGGIVTSQGRPAVFAPIVVVLNSLPFKVIFGFLKRRESYIAEWGNMECLERRTSCL